MDIEHEDSDLAYVLNGLSVGVKVIANATQHAGIKSIRSLRGFLGAGGGAAEEQYGDLNKLARDVLLRALRLSGKVGVASALGPTEGLSAPVFVGTGEGGSAGAHAVVLHPLDGSANITCNVSVGTIFGIYRTVDRGGACAADLLQPGNRIVASGYVLYGPATTLMISTGDGLWGFTMDPDYGEFVKHAGRVRIPDAPARIYSVNSGNSDIWDEPTKRFIRWAHSQPESYSSRYIGSMVADVHRIITCGGIFLYPADQGQPNGKLRLVYEGIPMAFLVEQAGGMATSGTARILDLHPSSLLHPIPVALGCVRDVQQLVACHAAAGKRPSCADLPAAQRSRNDAAS